jgi:hypothetical protein
MIKLIFYVSGGLLVALVLLNIFNAWAWGNWDQEGTGSLGFWQVFTAAGARLALVYYILIVITGVTWVLKGGSKTKQNRKSMKSNTDETSKPS